MILSMANKFFQNQWQNFKKVFKTEESRFYISVGFKVSGISFAITCFIYYIIFLVMRVNYAFFHAHGFPQLGEDSIFYEYVLSEALTNVPVLFAFHIFLFFIGVYVGWLILRPFRAIGKYCEDVLEKPNTPYHVDQFSNFQLLTRFSEFFFEYLREARRTGNLNINSVPPQYAKVHKPVLDVIYLLHFGLLMIIISICSAVFIIENSSAMFQSMIDLANKTLKNPQAVNQYFAHQMYIQDELIILTVLLIAFFYTLLGLHLYHKVSGAAFGIFSTMRAFMKGAYFSRVHLVGYAYIRDNTRKMNKYLEYVENNLHKNKPKG